MSSSTPVLDRHRLDDLIGTYLATTAAHIEPAGDVSSAEILEPIAALSARGKRLRAALVIAGHSAAGGRDLDASYDVAAALELFQVAALIHDDVLDRSELRRGLPATHKVIERVHTSHEWSGDSAHFGVSGGILAGDLALMASGHALSRAVSRLGGAHGEAVAATFSRMASLCTVGQYLDMRLAAAHDIGRPASAADVTRVMRCKTASYTTEGPLALGAALAGLDDARVALWAEAGVPLGIGFQLRDDVLGSVGTSTTTGKPSGEDIVEGKWTHLIVHTLGAGDASHRSALDRAFGRVDATEADVTAAVEALRSSGAVGAVEEMIASHEADAKLRLHALDMTSEGRDAIDALVTSAITRIS